MSEKNFVFNTTPNVYAKRNKFDLSYNLKTSTSMGRLTPFYIQEILPGDSFSCRTDMVIRLSSPLIKPIMETMFADVYYFFVPNRLTFNSWEDVLAVAEPNEWYEPIDTLVPTIDNNDVDSYVYKSSIGDYLGLPVGAGDGGESTIANNVVSILPFRANALIYNEFFRDENSIKSTYVQKDGFSGEDENLNQSPFSQNNYTGMCPQVSKFHDYFTSCLPNVQKGESIGLSTTGFVPLSTSSQLFPFDGSNVQFEFSDDIEAGPGAYPIGTGLSTTDSNITYKLGGISTAGTYEDINPIDKINIGVDLGSNSYITINDIRYALAIQRILERSARSGSRYTEYLYSAFNVDAGDSRLQRPEYLGGRRIPIDITQVASTSAGQTGAGDEITVGSLGAFSHTSGNAGFTKSFTEHGYIIGYVVFRQSHTYQQGIEKHWLRKSRFDFYDPALAHIGEQPVMRAEIFCDDWNQANFDNVFGYNESWINYRNRRDIITGDMRTGVSNSLDVWHLGDFYENAPVLGKQFLEETPIYLDRCLTITSDVQDQFILDVKHNVSAIRCLPLKGIPSII